MDPEPVSPPPNEQPVGGQPVAARILPPPVPSVAHRVDLPAPRMDRDALRRAAEEMMQSTLPNVDALSHFVNILMSYNSAATGQPAGAPAWAAEIRDSLRSLEASVRSTNAWQRNSIALRNDPLVYVPNSRGDPAPRGFPATCDDFHDLDARVLRRLLAHYDLPQHGNTGDLRRRLAAVIGYRANLL